MNVPTGSPLVAAVGPPLRRRLKPFKARTALGAFKGLGKLADRGFSPIENSQKTFSILEIQSWLLLWPTSFGNEVPAIRF
jgi:hypothetical protein